MELKVYNGELFERGNRWYIIMGIIFFTLFFLTLFSSKFLGEERSWTPGWTDVLSAFLLLALCGGYIFYVHREIEKIITVRVDPEHGLWIWTKLYQWHAVQWFTVEMVSKTGALHSVVFLINQKHEIHSLADTKENIVAFLEELEKYSSFVESYPQSRLEKISRRLKV